LHDVPPLVEDKELRQLEWPKMNDRLMVMSTKMVCCEWAGNPACGVTGAGIVAAPADLP
jgi:hypothetical protein